MRAARGFTFVEVMVALAIFSLVMLATVTGFRTLGNTAATIDRMTDRIDEVRSVSAFLRDALENSVVGAISGGGDALGFGGNSANAAPSAFFRVAEDSLEWRAKILFGEAYGGSHFLRLARRGENLVLQWQDPRGSNQPENWQDAAYREVLDDLEVFEVWTRLDRNAPWLRENTDRELPSHVKLVIKAGGRYWPDLIMPVQR